MSGMTQAPPLHGGLTSAWCPAGKAPSCNQTSLLFRLSDILCLLQRLVPATYTGLLEGQVAKRGASKQQAPQGGASVWLCGEKGGHSWGSWAPGGAEGVVRVTGDRGKGRQKQAGGRARLGGRGPSSPLALPGAHGWKPTERTCPPTRARTQRHLWIRRLHSPCSSSLMRTIPDPGTLSPRPLGTEGLEAGSRGLTPQKLTQQTFSSLSLAKTVSPSHLLGNEACRKVPNPHGWVRLLRRKGRGVLGPLAGPDTPASTGDP